MNELSLLAINLTRRCNLACPHCYLDADTLNTSSKGELTTDEVCNLLDQVVAMGHSTMIVLTGGEPLVRSDLEQIIQYGSDRDLPIVVGTNGVMLNRKRVESLKVAGVSGLGISLDSLNAERHDRFRGLPGAWHKTMAGIDHCRRQQLDFQLHFTVTAENVHELSEVAQFAANSGARVLNVFFVICTGRGTTFTQLSPARHEEVLQELVELQRQHPQCIVRPRCAPQFKRVALSQKSASATNLISGREGDGCIAGIHYCRVTSTGDITPCPYLPDSLGNVRESSITDLWNHSPVFASLRNGTLNGKCGACEYRELCGGCRAGAVAAGGALMDQDPDCV
ncbi:MAG: radical SAM protein, partial [Proteobacteria bacterium]|nr:radical SAM protein [Pseudomonadota bacterium]